MSNYYDNMMSDKFIPNYRDIKALLGQYGDKNIYIKLYTHTFLFGADWASYRYVRNAYNLSTLHYNPRYISDISTNTYRDMKYIQNTFVYDPNFLSLALMQYNNSDLMDEPVEGRHNPLDEFQGYEGLVTPSIAMHLTYSGLTKRVGKSTTYTISNFNGLFMKPIDRYFDDLLRNKRDGLSRLISNQDLLKYHFSNIPSTQAFYTEKYNADRTLHAEETAERINTYAETNTGTKTDTSTLAYLKNQLLNGITNTGNSIFSIKKPSEHIRDNFVFKDVTSTDYKVNIPTLVYFSYYYPNTYLENGVKKYEHHSKTTSKNTQNMHYSKYIINNSTNDSTSDNKMVEKVDFIGEGIQKFNNMYSHVSTIAENRDINWNSIAGIDNPHEIISPFKLSGTNNPGGYKSHNTYLLDNLDRVKTMNIINYVIGDFSPLHLLPFRNNALVYNSNKLFDVDTEEPTTTIDIGADSIPLSIWDGMGYIFNTIYKLSVGTNYYISRRHDNTLNIPDGIVSSLEPNVAGSDTTLLESPNTVVIDHNNSARSSWVVKYLENNNFRANGVDFNYENLSKKKDRHSLFLKSAIDNFSSTYNMCGYMDGILKEDITNITYFKNSVINNPSRGNTTFKFDNVDTDEDYNDDLFVILTNTHKLYLSDVVGNMILLSKINKSISSFLKTIEIKNTLLPNLLKPGSSTGSYRLVDNLENIAHVYDAPNDRVDFDKGARCIESEANSATVDINFLNDISEHNYNKYSSDMELLPYEYGTMSEIGVSPSTLFKPHKTHGLGTPTGNIQLENIQGLSENEPRMNFINEDLRNKFKLGEFSDLIYDIYSNIYGYNVDTKTNNQFSTMEHLIMLLSQNIRIDIIDSMESIKSGLEYKKTYRRSSGIVNTIESLEKYNPYIYNLIHSPRLYTGYYDKTQTVKYIKLNVHRIEYLIEVYGIIMELYYMMSTPLKLTNYNDGEIRVLNENKKEIIDGILEHENPNGTKYKVKISNKFYMHSQNIFDMKNSDSVFSINNFGQNRNETYYKKWVQPLVDMFNSLIPLVEEFTGQPYIRLIEHVDEETPDETEPNTNNRPTIDTSSLNGKQPLIDLVNIFSEDDITNYIGKYGNINSNTNVYIKTRSVDKNSEGNYDITYRSTDEYPTFEEYKEAKKLIIDNLESVEKDSQTTLAEVARIKLSMLNQTYFTGTMLRDKNVRADKLKLFSDPRTIDRSHKYSDSHEIVSTTFRADEYFDNNIMDISTIPDIYPTYSVIPDIAICRRDNYIHNSDDYDDRYYTHPYGSFIITMLTRRNEIRPYDILDVVFKLYEGTNKTELDKIKIAADFETLCLEGIANENKDKNTLYRHFKLIETKMNDLFSDKCGPNFFKKILDSVIYQKTDEFKDEFDDSDGDGTSEFNDNTTIPILSKVYRNIVYILYHMYVHISIYDPELHTVNYTDIVTMIDTLEEKHSTSMNKLAEIVENRFTNNKARDKSEFVNNHIKQSVTNNLYDVMLKIGYIELLKRLIFNINDDGLFNGMTTENDVSKLNEIGNIFNRISGNYTLHKDGYEIHSTIDGNKKNPRPGYIHNENMYINHANPNAVNNEYDPYIIFYKDQYNMYISDAYGHLDEEVVRKLKLTNNEMVKLYKLYAISVLTRVLYDNNSLRLYNASDLPLDFENNKNSKIDEILNAGEYTLSRTEYFNILSTIIVSKGFDEAHTGLYIINANQLVFADHIINPEYVMLLYIFPVTIFGENEEPSPEPEPDTTDVENNIRNRLSDVENTIRDNPNRFGILKSELNEIKELINQLPDRKRSTYEELVRSWEDKTQTKMFGIEFKKKNKELEAKLNNIKDKYWNLVKDYYKGKPPQGTTTDVVTKGELDEILADIRRIYRSGDEYIRTYGDNSDTNTASEFDREWRDVINTIEHTIKSFLYDDRPAWVTNNDNNLGALYLNSTTAANAFDMISSTESYYTGISVAEAAFNYNVVTNEGDSVDRAKNFVTRIINDNSNLSSNTISTLNAIRDIYINKKPEDKNKKKYNDLKDEINTSDTLHSNDIEVFINMIDNIYNNFNPKENMPGISPDKRYVDSLYDVLKDRITALPTDTGVITSENKRDILSYLDKYKEIKDLSIADDKVLLDGDKKKKLLFNVRNDTKNVNNDDYRNVLLNHIDNNITHISEAYLNNYDNNKLQEYNRLKALATNNNDLSIDDLYRLSKDIINTFSDPSDKAKKDELLDTLFNRTTPYPEEKGGDKIYKLLKAIILDEKDGHFGFNEANEVTTELNNFLSGESNKPYYTDTIPEIINYVSSRGWSDPNVIFNILKDEYNNLLNEYNNIMAGPEEERRKKLLSLVTDINNARYISGDQRDRLLLMVNSILNADDVVIVDLTKDNLGGIIHTDMTDPDYRNRNTWMREHGKGDWIFRKGYNYFSDLSNKNYVTNLTAIGLDPFSERTTSLENFGSLINSAKNRNNKYNGHEFTIVGKKFIEYNNSGNDYSAYRVNDKLFSDRLRDRYNLNNVVISNEFNVPILNNGYHSSGSYGIVPNESNTLYREIKKEFDMINRYDTYVDMHANLSNVNFRFFDKKVINGISANRFTLDEGHVAIPEKVAEAYDFGIWIYTGTKDSNFRRNRNISSIAGLNVVNNESYSDSYTYYETERKPREVCTTEHVCVSGDPDNDGLRCERFEDVTTCKTVIEDVRVEKTGYRTKYRASGVLYTPNVFESNTSTVNLTFNVHVPNMTHGSNSKDHMYVNYGIYYRFKAEGTYTIKFRIDISNAGQFNDGYTLDLNKYSSGGRVGPSSGYSECWWGRSYRDIAIKIVRENDRIRVARDQTEFTQLFKTLTRDAIYIRGIYAIRSIDDAGEWNEWQFATVDGPFQIEYDPNIE